MYFKRIFTKSLAHYSYAIGDGKELTIIDPQADINTYIDIARREEMQITRILETHRNEDFLVGSRALAEITGARVYISSYEDLGYEYGEKIKEGHVFQMKNISIKAIHTPGHTLGHLSYILYFKENPYMVFTGDTCFYGDIGRIDFYGEDRLEEMAGKIYDSIFEKIMPLGDHVIMCPAHGSGSACGENVEDRPMTSLGYERKYNPKLQYDSREDFIKANARRMFKPDYFTFMEEMNLKGVNPIDCNANIAIKHIEDIDFDREFIVDIRSQNAYNHAHIPASLYMNREDMISFINWIIPRKSNISIVADTNKGLNDLYVDLQRIGYTGEISFLAKGIASWYEENRKFEEIKTIMPREYENKKEDYFILDVRKPSETEASYGKEGTILPMESIREDYEKIADKKNILVVCPSGIRSNIVSGFLKSKDIETKVLLGGLKALK